MFPQITVSIRDGAKSWPLFRARGSHRNNTLLYTAAPSMIVVTLYSLLHNHHHHHHHHHIIIIIANDDTIAGVVVVMVEKLIVKYNIVVGKDDDDGGGYYRSRGQWMMNDVGSNNNNMDGTSACCDVTCTNQSLTAPLPSGSVLFLCDCPRRQEAPIISFRSRRIKWSVLFFVLRLGPRPKLCLLASGSYMLSLKCIAGSYIINPSWCHILL